MVLASINTLEELHEYRADPDDDDYKSPSAGGCWICRRGMRDEEWFDDFNFSISFDTYVHPGCLWMVGVDNVEQFEQGLWKDHRGRLIDHHRTGTIHIAKEVVDGATITECGIPLPHTPDTCSIWEMDGDNCTRCMEKGDELPPKIEMENEDE